MNQPRIAAVTLCLCSLVLTSLAPAAEAPRKTSPLNAALPENSFLTLSLRIGKLLEKAKFQKRLNWRPAIENDRSIPEAIRSFLIQPKSLGINLDTPTHLFAQLGDEKNKGLILGVLALVEDKDILDKHLDAFAKAVGSIPEKENGVLVRAKKGLPFLTAQRGRIILFLFASPSAMESPLVEDAEKKEDVSMRLRNLARSILDQKKKDISASNLSAHLGHPYDLALFFDQEKFAKFARPYAPDKEFDRILQTIGTLKGGLSLSALFNKGHSKFNLRRLPKQKKALFSGQVDPDLVALLPQDAIGTGGISLDLSVLKSLFQKIIGPEKPDREEANPKPPSRPTPNSPLIDALDAFTGDLIFAWSRHRKAPPVMTTGAFPTWTEAPAAFFIAAKIADSKKLAPLLHSSNRNSLLEYTLSASGLSLERNEKHLLLTTPDHRREILSGKTLRPLGKKGRNAFSEGPLRVQLDMRALASSLRQAIVPHYEFLMSMDILEEFDKITLSMDEEGDLVARVFLRDKEENALATLAKRLETEFTDRRNAELFRAIATNDLRIVDQQLRLGALVNAPDRSGHTPMHFAAYRGSIQVFEYLLRNGGKIDVRGRDKGTLLHSATWGRNRAVVESLLENGADVNARSDEGETPGMTAALRGEQELLEIFLSLAADPKARDKYDTGLLELAAAGGHAAIVKKLASIGVKPKYPFHVAAGLGDEKTVRKFVTSGTPIDQRDGFNSTPLLYATISGNHAIFDYLLGEKANPKIVAKEGYTLMHGAAFAKDKKLIVRLLNLGLDVNARYGDEGITPVDVAHESPQAVELLRLHGGKTSWELGRRP